jgi:uncharacterized Zn-binding protein involved in type VI secretion
MPPAARLTDATLCPNHGAGVITAIGAPTVIIGMMPAARVTDVSLCLGTIPDAIVMGSPTVIIQGLFSARIGDPTAHGGVVTTGFPTVIIGEVGAGVPSPPSAAAAAIVAATTAGIREALKDPPSDSPQSTALKDAAGEGTPFVEKCPYADH